MVRRRVGVVRRQLLHFPPVVVLCVAAGRLVVLALHQPLGRFLIVRIRAPDAVADERHEEAGDHQETRGD